MKINIANPSTGATKVYEIEDEKLYRTFYDKRIGDDVNGDLLGDAYKGYTFRVTGGLDKQGFAMKQGVLTPNRVRLLLDGTTGHYTNRRKGDRRRKSVRGCIVSSEMSVVNVIVVKKGDAEIASVTDKTIPQRLGPKRASRIRKFFNLTKEDDVRQFVIRRTIPGKEGKRDRTVAPKIQRLVTPVTLRRRRQKVHEKAARFAKQVADKKEYQALLQSVNKEKRSAAIAKARTTAANKAAKAAKVAPVKK
jgi:small subunit ribosomal protein S6e